MKVAVLGCGPAGLFAAHAAVRSGHDVEIFSKRRKSRMFGAQYLHRNIPLLTNEAPDFGIHYVLRGGAEAYAQKVYGDVPPDFVSPSELHGLHPAWDIRMAYDVAWDIYGDLVQDVTIDPLWIVMTLLRKYKNRRGYDRIISTIPAPEICREPSQHSFLAREAWAIGDAPELGIECPVEVEADTVVCDGTDDVGWYRASNIRGFKTAEYPEYRKPPIPDIARVTKVVRTNCNCWAQAGFWRTGRYGAWNKRLLTHHAYWGILDAFQPDRKRKH